MKMWRPKDRGEVNEIVLCDCPAECAGLKITKFSKDLDPDNETYITIYWHGNYPQHKSRWKLLWHALSGRPFHIGEIILNENNCRQLARALVKGYDDDSNTGYIIKAVKID